MAQVRQLDGNILSWVKNEIDTTINQAKQALEAHVEAPDDQSQLQFCLNYLHQVYGTLQMVEIYGASMLAEEMERLIQAIVDKRVTNANDAYEVLMRGMMQLPDYLEKLQSGQPDYPIILLPLLNDMRAVRNAGLLTENALFSPNLDVDAPIPLERAEAPIDTLARKLRHAYHLGLLDWFRGTDIKLGLKKLAAVIEKLRQSANDPDASRMLWAASGVVESLRDQGIDSSAAVKSLMGQVDRQFKKLIDNGEFALSTEPPRDLLKNLLYYVASSNSLGDRVKEIKKAFNLATVMPDKETLSRARADLSAPNAALMRTVSTVMLDDLTQIKDTLDVFMRSSQRDLSVLNTMGTKLTQMADTLGMLGFGNQRQILLNQITLLQDMAAGKREITEPVLMDTAAALLGIEEVLTDPNANKPVEQPQESDDSQARSFHDPEQRKLIKRVVDEAKVDLSIIKDAFNEYGRMPKQVQLLKDVPGLLDRIRGSLSILALDRAANILKSAANYVQVRILNTNTRPDNRALELLADSISSVEYYLESLVDSWGHPTSILEVAEQSLLDLGATQLSATDAASAGVVDVAAEEEGNTLVDLAMPGVEDENVATTQQMTAAEVVDEEQLSADDPTLIDIEGFDDLGQLDRAENIAEPEVEGSISQEFNLPVPDQVVEQPAVMSRSEAPATTVPLTTMAQKSTIADELDDEIVEIFLEEAQEEHGNISRLLPAWQNNPENEPTLKELRRSFHTLKGSGRLVGAVDVGEFAWAFENMLNRVIDHTIMHSPEMFQLLDNARSKLLDLLRLFRSGGKPGQDVFALMAQAEAISHGKGVAAATSKPVPKAAPKPAAVTPPSPPPAPVQPVSPAKVEAKVPAPHSEPVIEIPLEMESMAEELTLDDVSLPLETENEIVLGEISLGEASDEALTLETIELAEFPIADSENLEQLEIASPEMAEEPIEIAFSAEQDVEVAEDNTEVIPLPVPTIDPVLLDIYRKEIDSHLANLNECIADWYEGKNRKANPKLVRAVHTIKGSSRTAGMDEIADICGALEDHLRVLVEHQIDVNAELISLIQQGEQYVERAMQVLDIPGSALPNHKLLLAKIVGLAIDVSKAAKKAPVAVVPQPTGLIIEDDSGVDTSKTPDYDTELLEIFLEEGVDILNESDQTLHNWQNEPDNKEHVRALQRQLHTLKGGARMAGVAEIGDLSHSIETMLTAVAEQDLPINQQMFQVLQKAQDRLVNMLEIVRLNQVPNQAHALINAINVLSAGNVLDEQPLDEAIAVEAELIAEPIEADDGLIEVDIPLVNVDETDFSIDTPTVEVIAPVLSDEIEEIPSTLPNNVIPFTAEPAVEFIPAAAPLNEPTTADSAAVRARSEMVRVRTDLLENLVNFAGEVSIYRSRMEQQNNSFRYNIKELDETVTRLREQLRKFEIETETQIQFRYEEAGATHAGFDPLEMDRFTQMQTLSRGMLESLNDLDSLRSILNNLTRESETLLLQQSRVNTELQEGLMRTRMVPVTGQVPRLRRIVRQAADETGKKAELHIEGAETELDRTILERVMSPIEHMLRNAVAHGIESPEARTATRKAETGAIHLKFAKEAGDIVISVSDDGRGIDLGAIRRKAVERGMIKADATLTKSDLLDLIMQPGFSTAESITQLAGRGVGMDVVNNEVKQLGGHLDINTEEGRGTHFRISMPVSLSVARALMVHVSENTYAIPLIGVETVERVPRDEILRLQADKESVYRWLDNDYRYIHLSSMLGLTELQAPLEEQRRIPLLLIRAGEYRAAIHVDGLIGSREIVVKPVGPQLSILRGITGATIMGDGSVVLILDLGVLVRSIFVEVAEKAAEEAAPQVVEAPEKRVPLVMVVDDSITVRKVTTRFLERNNFRTLAAKDGVDALTQLQEQRPDIMLLDVEMPRMDGFELATNIRNDANLMHLPIIMITSRTGQKHRDRALDIGVNIYMGKPYSEAELLDNINKLLSD